MVQSTPIVERQYSSSNEVGPGRLVPPAVTRVPQSETAPPADPPVRVVTSGGGEPAEMSKTAIPTAERQSLTGPPSTDDGADAHTRATQDKTCTPDRESMTPPKAAKRKRTGRKQGSREKPAEQVLRVIVHSLPDAGRTLTSELRGRVGTGTPVAADVLIDTGATHSVLSAAFYEKLKARQSIPEELLCVDDQVNTDWSGAFECAPGAARPIGRLRGVDIQIGDSGYKADFYVFPGSTTPVILGMDFLMLHRAVVNLDAQPTVTLRQPSAHALTGAGEGVRPNVNTVRPVTVLTQSSKTLIGARSRELITVKVALPKAVLPTTVVFEPAIGRHPELVLPSQLMELDAEGFGKVYVENRGQHPFEVPVRFLGSASELSVSDASSRHAGAHAIFCPVSRIEGGARRLRKGKGKSTGARKRVGAYGFIHHCDYDSLLERVESDLSKVPLAGYPEPENSESHCSEGALRHLRTAPGGQHSWDACPPGARKRRRRRKPKASLSSAMFCRARRDVGKPSQAQSPPPPSPGPVGEQGGRSTDAAGAHGRGAEVPLPDHLECMMPRKGDVTEKQSTELRALVREYEDIFATPGGEVGFTNLATHAIDVGGAKPVKQPPRKSSFAEKTIIENSVLELLKSGKIRKSHSAWASPVVLVRKKDGSIRFCVDYRRLNEVTIKDAYPLPRIDDALDYLSGAAYFSTLDLASAYWQVAMEPGCEDMTAFCTHIGLYEWLVMPFGLANAPATCERLMEQLFQGMQWNGVLVYLDDLVAYGGTWSQSLLQLRKVFQKLREANLTLKPKKCELMRSECTYLGHRVTQKGVSPEERKVEAVRHWPEPRTLDHVRSFLGMTGYYRKFIEDYAAEAKPLTAMLKKGMKFEWGKDQRRAFERLRDALTSYPCLGKLRPLGRLVVDTDASDYAVGAVLSQIQDGQERVIAYHSKTLNDAQTRYCTTKKELFAVKSALETWDHYLQNPSERFLLRTDHAALKWLSTMAIKDRTLSRWAQFVTEYSFDFVHRPGAQHSNADALSRVRYRPCEFDGCATCGSKGVYSDEEYVKREHGELRVLPGHTVARQISVVTRSQTKQKVANRPNTRSQTRVPRESGGSLTRSGVVEKRGADPAPKTEASGGPSISQRRRKRRRLAKTKQKEATPRGRRALDTKRSVEPPPAGVCGNTGKMPARQTRRGRGRKRKAGVPGVQTKLVDRDISMQQVGGERVADAGAEVPVEVTTKLTGPPASSNLDSFEQSKSGVLAPPSSVDLDFPGDSDRGSAAGEPAPSQLDFDSLEKEYATGDEAEIRSHDWAALQRKDPDLRRLAALVEVFGENPPPKDQLAREREEIRALCASWHLLEVGEDGILRYFRRDPCAEQETKNPDCTGRIVVPQAERVELARFMHRSTAHLSYRRLCPSLRKRFWWRTMGTDLKAWIRCCDLCQQRKSGDKRGRYPLKQGGYGAPLDRVSFDLSGPWPVTKQGNKYILAITDYFSKWLELVALPDKTAIGTANALNLFVLRHGVVRVLHSDRGTEFTAAVVRRLSRILGVQQTFTSGGAPWSNAQVERSNQTIGPMLCTLTRQNESDWDECLPYVMQAYNGTVHASTGYTPYLLLHSTCQDPRLPVDLLTQVPVAPIYANDLCRTDFVEKRKIMAQEVHHLVREALKKAATSQSLQFEKAGLRPHPYAPGEECWLYYPPNVKDKLGFPWTGPYKVLAVDAGRNLVRLDLGKREKWVNAANCKPVRKLPNGDFL